MVNGRVAAQISNEWNGTGLHASRFNHRHDVRLDRLGQGWPSVDDGLKFGVDVRGFRFNCPRICPRVFRIARFPWVLGAWLNDCRSSIAGSNPAGASSELTPRHGSTAVALSLAKCC